MRCRGTPDYDEKYDRLTFWEQLDGGTQYTLNKKFLTIIPIVLFLFTMTFTLLVAFGRCMYILIVSWPPVNFLSESGALESLFALVSVSSLLWLAYDPARFVLKGEWFKMKLPPRWFELGLLIAILAGFLYLRQQNIDVENAAN